MTIETMIGIDLAKSVFQIHGVSMTEQLKFRKFMARHPMATVVMEACGSVHYWAREIARQGYEIKLIAP